MDIEAISAETICISQHQRILFISWPALELCTIHENINNASFLDTTMTFFGILSLYMFICLVIDYHL